MKNFLKFRSLSVILTVLLAYQVHSLEEPERMDEKERLLYSKSAAEPVHRRKTVIVMKKLPELLSHKQMSEEMEEKFEASRQSIISKLLTESKSDKGHCTISVLYDSNLLFNDKIGSTSSTTKNAIVDKNNEKSSTPEQEFLKMRTNAFKGDAYAAFRLAQLHEQGIGIEMSTREAFKWYQTAAELGSLEAQKYLGMLYRDGKYTKLSFEKAANWFRKAVDQGDLSAQYDLGKCLIRSRKKETMREGVKWLVTAAQHDEPQAKDYFKKNVKMLNVFADDYVFGRGGCPLDIEEARKYYKLAVAQEKSIGSTLLDTSTYAAYQLGASYFNEKKYVEGRRWLVTAANHGDEDALYKLGLCALQGLGQEKNIQQAIEYFKKAAQRGHKSSQEKLAMLALPVPNLESSSSSPKG